MITKEELLQKVIYDIVEGKLFWKPKTVKTVVETRFNTRCAGKEVGYTNIEGYKAVRIQNKMYLIHRLIWLLEYDLYPKQAIDHVDGNKLNNVISNLRLCTSSENQQNLYSATRKNISGFLGVSKKKNKYSASIGKDNKLIYLGLFNTPEEAYERYLQEKRLLHPYGNL